MNYQPGDRVIVRVIDTDGDVTVPGTVVADDDNNALVEITLDSCPTKGFVYLLHRINLKPMDAVTALGMTGRAAALEAALEAVEAVLPSCDDLRRPPWRGSACAYAGHCYVSCEAIYHLAGMAEGFRPATVRHEGAVHWFLVRQPRAKSSIRRHCSSQHLSPTTPVADAASSRRRRAFVHWR